MAPFVKRVAVVLGMLGGHVGAYTLPEFFVREGEPSPFSNEFDIFFSAPDPDPLMLSERDTNNNNDDPSWYHHGAISPTTRQWTFGTAQESYNLSTSNCLHLSDHIGIYTLGNGTTLVNATLHEILSDLIPPPSSSSPSDRNRNTAAAVSSVHYARRVLENAQFALQEAEQYLTSYALAPQDPATTPPSQQGAKYYEELRRHLLAVPGTRSAIIVKVGLSTGIALGAQGYLQSASPNSTYAPYAAAGAAAGGIALTFAIIDLLQQEGMLFAPFEEVVGATRIGRGLKALESMVASIFLAVFRRVMRLAVGSAERQRGHDPVAIAAGYEQAPGGRPGDAGSGVRGGGVGGGRGGSSRDPFGDDYPYGGGGTVVRGGGVGGGRGGSSRDPFGDDYPYGGGGSVVRTGGVGGGRGGSRVSDPFADDPFGAGGDPYGIGGGSVGYGGSGGVDYGFSSRTGGGSSSSRYDTFGGSSAYGGGFGSGSGFGGGGGFGQGSRGTQYGGYASGAGARPGGGPNIWARLTRTQVEAVARDVPYLSDERVGLLSYERYDDGGAVAGAAGAAAGAAAGGTGAAAAGAGAAIEAASEAGSSVSEYYDCPV
ncbi:MAG: hypothetical protein HETSPECPRED_007300 [Heterodermia speciosa]|uniref:Uncharacterized protein n=1 Tax=Heterodermia speciosa TaxID=116794 RepID=A0A8H3FN91_9LECA|nr:MAG: hypothetical protein HETSPECPRED_007300 [Heterodermia speciosa]